jgi:hypothetical protein
MHRQTGRRNADAIPAESRKSTQTSDLTLNRTDLEFANIVSFSSLILCPRLSDLFLLPGLSGSAFSLIAGRAKLSSHSGDGQRCWHQVEDDHSS